MTKSLINKRFVAGLGALLLASCGTGEEPYPTQAPIPAEELKLVSVTDELGKFETAVSGIALWSHPILVYKGGVMAANGAAGLIFIDTEAFSPTTLEGTFTSGVAVSYLGDESLIAAYDASANQLRLLNVAFDPLRLEDWTIGSGEAYLPSQDVQTCVARRPKENLAQLVLIDQQGQLTYASVKQNSDSALIVSNRKKLETPTLKGCATDDRSGQTYLLGADGFVYGVDLWAEDGEPALKKVLRLPDLSFSSLSIVLQAESQAQLLAASEGSPGAIYSYDLSTGASNGAFTIGELVDIEAVSSISAIAAEGSNFGGVHRNGVLALVEGAESLKLKLVPWSGIARQLDLPIETELSRRALAEPAEKEFKPNFDLPDLESN